MQCSVVGENNFFTTTTQIIQWECTDGLVYALTLAGFAVINITQQWIWAHLLQLKRRAQRQARRDRQVLPIALWQLLSSVLGAITILLIVSKNAGVLLTSIVAHAVGVWWVYGHQMKDSSDAADAPDAPDAQRMQRMQRMQFHGSMNLGT